VCYIFANIFDLISFVDRSTVDAPTTDLLTIDHVPSDSPSDSPHSTRLLVIVNVVRPDLGGGVLFSDLFEGMNERGIQVTVKCAYSYYPEWKDKSGKNGFQIAESIESGVSIERHGLFIPSDPNSLLQRLLYEASFFLSLRRRIPQPGQYDAVLVFCPLMGSVAYAASVKGALKIPMWLNVQDLSAQAASAGGITDSGLVSDILLDVQNTLFSRADLWTSISRPMIDVLKRHNSSNIPIQYAPNWLHPSLAGHITTALQSTNEANGPEFDPGVETKPVKLLYSGNVGTKQNLLAFCRELSALNSPFHFRIQAAGGRRAELHEWIKTSCDHRFELLPLSDEKSLAEALVQCDYYVITEKPGSGNSFIPSKLIPAITSQTPILAVCEPDSPLGEEMISFDLGPLLKWPRGKSRYPSDVDQFGSLSTELSSLISPGELRSDNYKTWQKNCAERSSFYDRESAIDRYVTILTDLLSRPID
jgi:putative colanic acid biosynthesis glycosyltransferase WcaI